MSYKILVLNRNKDLHDTIKKWDSELYLDENYLFYYVKTEEEAIDFLEHHPDIDLILADVKTGQPSYYDFLEKFQSSSPMQHYVLISNGNNQEHIQRALEQGAFEHLTMPIKKESLTEIISRSKSHKENQKEFQKPESTKYDKLRKTMDQAIHAIAHICELKDPYTAGHQKRVAQISLTIAKHLNLDSLQTEEIYNAGLLHDIGKIVIPSEILTRPGGLSVYEMELIKQHPSAGFDILKDIEFPWNIKSLVAMHHERLDGSGYPSQLSRNEIPLGARILSVADVFEAVTSYRPYRPALGIKKGIEVLKNEADKQKLDPIIVSACIDLISRGMIS